MARLLSTSIFAFAAALAMLGALSGATVTAAALLASAATLGAWALGRTADRRFRFSRRDARQWLRTGSRLPIKTLRTALAFARAAFTTGPGHVLQPRFDHGAEADARARARRATALLTASLAPDSFVVMIGRGSQALLHSIVAQADEPHPEWL